LKGEIKFLEGKEFSRKILKRIGSNPKSIKIRGPS
jgi:hypothetical protein